MCTLVGRQSGPCCSQVHHRDLGKTIASLSQIFSSKTDHRWISPSTGSWISSPPLVLICWGCSVLIVNIIVSPPFVINIVHNDISLYFINVYYQPPAPRQARVKTVRGSIMLVILGEGTVDDWLQVGRENIYIRLGCLNWRPPTFKWRWRPPNEASTAVVGWMNWAWSVVLNFLCNVLISVRYYRRAG